MKTITSKFNRLTEAGGDGLKINRKQNTGQRKNSELDKKLSLLEQRVKNMVALSFEKTVAHYENPSDFPLSTDIKSVERAFYNLLQELPRVKRNKIIDEINLTLKASPEKRKALYGDIVNVNFKSAVPVAQQIKAFELPQEMKLTEPETNELAAWVKKNMEKSKKKAVNAKNGVARQASSAAATVSLLIDSMTCSDTDDVRKDEISLAGFATDTDGNSFELAPIFIGKFKKGDTISLNGRKLFTLNINDTVDAQLFSAGLFIVESDLIANEEVIKKLSVLCVAVGGAISVITLAAILVSVFITPVITVPIIVGSMITQLILQPLGMHIIPLMGDDVSFAVTDTLAFQGKLDPGTVFDRTLLIEDKGFLRDFRGSYSITARWLAE
jgi:hypothetical protein